MVDLVWRASTQSKTKHRERKRARRKVVFGKENAKQPFCSSILLECELTEGEYPDPAVESASYRYLSSFKNQPRCHINPQPLEPSREKFLRNFEFNYKQPLSSFPIHHCQPCHKLGRVTTCRSGYDLDCSALLTKRPLPRPSA